MTLSLNDGILINLKDKIDAIIQKGNELSQDLSVDERYKIMKRLILEGIDKALANISKSENGTIGEAEAIKKDQLLEFVQNYFDDKFSESMAREWDAGQRHK